MIGIFFWLSLLCSVFVMVKVPEPYMDEIFHIPQGIRYLSGNVTYHDPKITTPPGLYISTAFLFFFPLSTPVYLRFINLVFALLLFRSLKSLDSCKLSAFNLSLLPFLWFFTHLYYTDMGSTYFCLMGFFYASRSHFWKSGIFCLLSLLFRQTNIMWAFYSAAIICISIIKSKSSETEDNNLKLLLQPSSQFFEKSKFDDVSCLLTATLSVIAQPQFWISILKGCALHIFSLIAFVVFVMLNGSVALGDKENHVITVHAAQIIYFFLFTFLFSPLRFIPTMREMKRLLTLETVVVQIFLMLGVYYVQMNYAKPHPFLLADNRHFTFYLWRKLLDRNYTTKLLLTPCYAMSICLVLRKLSDNLNIVQLICFLFSTVTVLIATPLLEFRYFIIPTLLTYLTCKPSQSLRKLQIAVDLIMYSVINVMTLYLFLYRPFKWENEPGKLQRFMW